MKVVLIAIVALLVIGGVWFVGARNTLVAKDENVRGAWSQVQNAYQRRADLIPNLVETVKGASNFEKETFTEVAEARARAGSIQVTPEVLNDPESFRKFEESQRQLGGALSRLIATAEAYPDLKSNANFRDLQSQLEGTENRISVERKRFNDAVQDYNLSTRQFPGSMVAGMSGMRERPYFQADTAAQTAPKVNF